MPEILMLGIVFALKFLCAMIGYLSGPIQLASAIAVCVISYSSLGLTDEAAHKNIIFIAILIALFAALVYSSEWIYMLIGGAIFSAILCALVFGLAGIPDGFRIMGVMSIITIVLSVGRTVLIFFGVMW